MSKKWHVILAQSYAAWPACICSWRLGKVVGYPPQTWWLFLALGRSCTQLTSVCSLWHPARLRNSIHSIPPRYDRRFLQPPQIFLRHVATCLGVEAIANRFNPPIHLAWYTESISLGQDFALKTPIALYSQTPPRLSFTAVLVH